VLGGSMPVGPHQQPRPAPVPVDQHGSPLGL